MSEITVESLQEELKAMKTALEEASATPPATTDSDRLAYLEGEHKTLIKARDDAKEAARLAEEAKLTENGEFKTLAETAQAQVADLKLQMEGKDAAIEVYNQRDEAEFKELLEKVPEAMRESISDESLPLAKRLELAKKLSTDTKGTPPAFRGTGEPGTITLQAEYDAAVESGDMATQLRLKREIHEAKG